jgi:hypothetical protein
MEKEMLKLRPMGGRSDTVQYALAAALIWAAVGFGLWQQAHPPEQPQQLLLALQPVTASCDPS